MKRQNPNRIHELRLAKRWNQRELADAVGVHYMTISKLERGEMKLTQDWMERLAPALNVTPAEIIADSSLRRMIYLEGHIGADGLYDNEYDPRGSFDPVDFELDLGVVPPDTSLWLGIRPPFFGSIVQEGSIARFTFYAEREADEFLGYVCLIEQREDVFVAGVVHRGKEQGTYDLTLPNGGYLRGVRPISFGVLTVLLPLSLYTPENFDGTLE